MDDKLTRGEEISQAKESWFSIAILSKNYASSTWCFDELMKILGARKTKQQMVLPVYDNVNPLEVRHQTKSVGEAVAKLESRFKGDTKTQQWNAGLKEVANLSGHDFGKRYYFLVPCLMCLITA